MAGMGRRLTKGTRHTQTSSDSAGMHPIAASEATEQALPQYGQTIRDLVADPATSFATRRTVTEARLSRLLERTRSDATLDDVRSLIFFESNVRHPSEYFADIIALFPPAGSAIDIDALLPVIQDAWNYFPHLSLQGRCPAEVMHQELARARPRRRST
jgi:hypothetical protein